MGLQGIRALSSKLAAQLDEELMSTGAFSIDQLMELAGLSVAQAIYRQYPPKQDGSSKVLVLVGPGNNGGDGLVASRHLKLWGYDPVVYYPKKLSRIDLYGRLVTQLKDMDVPEIDSVEEAKRLIKGPTLLELIVDSLFGFSFKPPVRAPFDDLLRFLSENHGDIAPVVSVDIPSGWDVDSGPLEYDIKPSMLISLTAPKPCAAKFASEGGAHYLGGRFISPRLAEKYNISDITSLYKKDNLVVKL